MRQCPACYQPAISPLRAVFYWRCPACGATFAPRGYAIGLIVPWAIATTFIPRNLPFFEHMSRFAMLFVPTSLLWLFIAVVWLPLEVPVKSGKTWGEHTAREKGWVMVLLIVILTVIAYAVLRQHGHGS
jgi:hypothetical protein